MQRLNFGNEPKPVLVVGSVAYDDIITPEDTGERILGGSASYGALAASYFAPTRLVGVVGHDFNPDYIERFTRHDIDLEGLKTDASGPTFFWRGQYHENFSSRDTLEIQLNVFENFRPELPEGYQGSPFLFLGNINPELQHYVLDSMEGEPYVAADTIDLWIKTKRDEWDALLKRINLLVINDSEAEQMTGEKNIVTSGRKLKAMGPESVIIKKGEHGAYLFHEDGLFALPSYPVTALRDPTGAGDSFAGAMVGFLAAAGARDFEAHKHALAYATVTASLTVEAFSCDRLESAGAAELKKRYEELVRMVSF